MELPASREYHNRVAHQAASLGWPSPAEALAIADAEPAALELCLIWVLLKSDDVRHFA